MANGGFHVEFGRRKLDLVEHDVDSVRRSPIFDASALARKETTWLVHAAGAPSRSPVCPTSGTLQVSIRSYGMTSCHFWRVVGRFACPAWAVLIRQVDGRSNVTVSPVELRPVAPAE